MNRQVLGKKDLFSLALGSVIGWGAFVLPGNAFLKNAGVINTAIGFSIAVCFIYFIEKCYAVLIKAYPKSGGEFNFASQCFGDREGFFTGWLLLLAYISIIPLNATAVPLVLESVFSWYSPGPELYKFQDYSVYAYDLIVSLFSMLFFVFLHLKGINSTKSVQNILIFFLISSICMLTFLTFSKYNIQNEINLESHMKDIDVDLIVRIIAFAPWAFIGFDTVAQMTEEYKVSARSASLSAFFAVIGGALVYNVLNIITAVGINSSELNEVTWATGEAVKNIGGNYALYLVAIAMFGAVLSGLNGFFMSATRLFSAMFPEKTILNNSVSSKKTIIIVGLIASIAPFFGRNILFWFVDLSSVGASFAYLMTCLSAFKLASTKKSKLTAILGVVSSTAFLFFLLTPYFESNIPSISMIILVLWILFGLIVFIYSKNSLEKENKLELS